MHHYRPFKEVFKGNVKRYINYATTPKWQKSLHSVTPSHCPKRQ
ncbi:hypothetical protein BTURTLESOX_1304 [bacterium endosymbiont of Bathymodiolus sp. 5 South]|nr:hypothetical protein BTURTLESOX_1304 [bacterium endosymbiont of Bathymodiolus sp. 5 South]VVH56847.1 hypothetical protein BSPCLSOX_245 [uncultured Gammaproteobacteria bacterium]VVH62434.1 hypothetical protein BSPWISOX_695 [uncultured Gammaproteobacteria bacterium]